MIQANEFRIGNYLLYRGEKESKVSSIGTNGFETTYIGKDQPNGSSDLYEYQPIPLTEEWLVMFGFKSESKWDSTKEWFNIDLKDKNSLSININQNTYCVGATEWGEWTFPSSIYYVHQLQNLYFALTGEELKLNDK